MTIAVKYCGGCNPRYDRTALLARLKADFPQVAFATGATALAGAYGLLVLCGCGSRCAEMPALAAGQSHFVLAAPADYAQLAAWVQSGL